MSKFDDKSISELREMCEERGITVESKDSRARLLSKLKKVEGETESARQTQEEDHGKAVLSFEEQREILNLQLVLRERESQLREKERQQDLELKRLEIEQKRLELELQKKDSIPTQTNYTTRCQMFKVRDMKDDEDVEEYFQIFEKAALALKIPKEDWVGNLCHRLNDKSRSVFLELSEAETKNYETVREKILDAHQLTAEYYRHKFRTSVKKSNEDFSSWAMRTHRYFDHWMRAADCQDDADKISEQIVIEQLIDSVSPELQIWLKDHKINSTLELGKRANEYVQARKGPRIDGKYIGKKQFTSKSKSGESKNVLAEARTLVSPEHKTELVSKQGKAKERTPKELIKCYNCQELGHYANSCPKSDRRKLAAKGNAQGYLCFKPIDEEMNVKSFSLTGRINCDEAKMLVDSGCSRTLVHRKFLRPQMKTGQFMSVLLANGESLTIPLARVQIESKHGNHEELVGIVDDLPVDCLLGRSSYGRSLTREDLLEQWENEIPNCESIEFDEAFVVTRRQAGLKAAQERRDKVIDRENEVVKRVLLNKKDLNKAKPSDNLELNKFFLDDLQEGQNGKSEIVSSEIENDTKDLSETKSKMSSERGFEIKIPEEFQNILSQSRADIILYQKTDPSLKALKVLDVPPVKDDGYFYNEDILMHRKRLQNHVLPYNDRIVVPQYFRQEILRIAHSIPASGHMGVEKTRQRVETHFFWPGFYSDIRTYCATCPECQIVARKRISERAPLKPVPIISEPFSKVAIDIVGELPRTSTGYKYILTLVDYATRYPEAIPLRSIYSKSVADALILIFSRVGIPRELVSDQASNFIGQLMTHFYNEFGIIKIQTSVYHPEANGLVERFNGTIKSMLRKLANNDIRHWDKYIPFLLFAYREVPNSSTGFSPFELLFGRPVRGPLALVKETWNEKKPKNTDVVNYVLNMRERMAQIKELVQENLRESQTKQKTLFDRKSSVRKFQVGDNVLVLLPTPGSKLETHWQGPYEVVQISDDMRNYKVDTKKKTKRFRTYNIGLLRLWRSKQEEGMLAIVPNEISDAIFEERNLLSSQVEETWQNVQISPDLNDSQKQKVREILKEYADVFSSHPKQTTAAMHEINTGDAVPIRCSPHRIPKGREQAYYAELDYMLKTNIIRPSKSPWASPTVIVPKPDGTIRFCVDYRKLNRVTKMDAFPMPRTNEMIERIASAFYISTLDLTKGYWQIPLASDSIEKSAFVTPKGLFEFLVMPFGLKTASATFQRMMKVKVLQGLEDSTDAYIDDVEIDTVTFSEHINWLESVLKRLRKYNLTAKPSKCKIAFPSVDFVGHHVGSNAIRPKFALIHAVERFPRPLTKKDVRSFLGLVGFYRKFIDNFAHKAAALSDITRGKTSKIQWSKDCEKSFQLLKKELTKPPVLRPPDWHKEFVVQVDASNRGVGAILAQRYEKDSEHPVCFISRKLKPVEQFLSTTEKECLALVWSLCTLRYYLTGRTFLIQVDHNPLVWLDRVKDKNQKLLRWSLALQEFNFRVEYKKANAHTNADALSRY